MIQASKSDSIYYSTMEISVLQVTPQRRNLSGYMYHDNSLGSIVYAGALPSVIVDTGGTDEVWLCNLYCGIH